MMYSCCEYLILTLVLQSFTSGFCAIDTVIPEPGSIIIGRENQENITLFCALTLDGDVQATSWHIADEGESVGQGSQITSNTANYILGGDPLGPNTTLTLDTNLTILSLTADLDGMVIFCGRDGLLDAANFSLRIYMLPGPPFELRVVAGNIGATWIQLCWQEPSDTGSLGIAEYRIRFNGQTLDTGSNVNNVNVTDLMPNTLYVFTVAGISSFLGVLEVGPESNGTSATTLTTVPTPVCSSAPVSSDGDITAEWNYTHTGGLDLTQVTVRYRSLPNGELTVPPGGNRLNPTTQFNSITVEGLVAGEEYEFQVTAENSVGSATVVCPQVSHTVGVPPAPNTPTDVSSTSPGEVTLTLSTSEAGTRQGEAITFIVTATRVSDSTETTQSQSYPDYMDQQEVTFTFSSLESGESYIFSAAVRNMFGTSSSSGNSGPVTVEKAGTDDTSNAAIAIGVANVAAVILLNFAGSIIAVIIFWS